MAQPPSSWATTSFCETAKGTRFVFTVNNPGTFEPTWNPDRMEYLIYGREVGASGTPHLQGYVVLKKVARYAAVQDLLGTTHMWIKVARGSEKQAAEYCKKDGVFVEKGVFVPDRGASQGKRTDLIAAADAIKAGANIKAIALEHPSVLIKYAAGVREMITALKPQPPLERDIHTTVLWGPTGVGKSHRILHAYPGAYVCSLKDRNPWDFYEDQTVLFLDEFEPTSTSIQDLNRLLDKWPCKLQARYSNKVAYWTQVFIAANSPPTEWFQGFYAQALVDSFHRRISEPMGRSIEIVSREQEVNLVWWQPPSLSPAASIQDLALAAAQAAAQAASSTAPAVQTPVLGSPGHRAREEQQDPNPAPLKRHNARNPIVIDEDMDESPSLHFTK
ncbi:Rep [uncultured virus]|uniref:Rep n=1 Tax=uncultured virus TaxID=340016 RepID=A0A2K9LV70_9VIRU|nr:Rep [uncultured virus]